MSVSGAFAPHIHFLRRFARALTGTQAGGDAYVVATLEALLTEPGCLNFRTGSEGRTLQVILARLARRASKQLR